MVGYFAQQKNAVVIEACARELCLSSGGNCLGGQRCESRMECRMEGWTAFVGKVELILSVVQEFKRPENLRTYRSDLTIRVEEIIRSSGEICVQARDIFKKLVERDGYKSSLTTLSATLSRSEKFRFVPGAGWAVTDDDSLPSPPTDGEG